MHPVERGQKHGPGLAGVDRFKRLQLAGEELIRPESSACPPTNCVAPAAWASTAHTSGRQRWGLHIAGHHFESQRQQRVAGQDRHAFAKCLMASRPAATQVVVVHRRQIVVDQRVGMDHFHGTRRPASRLLAFRRKLRRPAAPAWAATACRERADYSESLRPSVADIRHQSECSRRAPGRSADAALPHSSQTSKRILAPFSWAQQRS